MEQPSLQLEILNKRRWKVSYHLIDIGATVFPNDKLKDWNLPAIMRNPPLNPDLLNFHLGSQSHFLPIPSWMISTKN